MRTTLTLDPDVARLLADEVHRRRLPFKQIVNEAIRRGLVPGGRRPTKPYRVVPHQTALRPGLDPMALGRLADHLEDDVVIARSRRRSR